MLISVVKIRLDKKTGNTEEIPLNLDSSEISCLYKDKTGNFILTKNGLTHKIDLEIKELEVFLE